MKPPARVRLRDSINTRGASPSAPDARCLVVDGMLAEGWALGAAGDRFCLASNLSFALASLGWAAISSGVCQTTKSRSASTRESELYGMPRAGDAEPRRRSWRIKPPEPTRSR